MNSKRYTGIGLALLLGNFLSIGDANAQAPKFDDKEVKTTNAKILYLWLNGILIQNNIELPGPTNCALNQNQIALGTLGFKGDQGSVAFENISYTNFNKPNSVAQVLNNLWCAIQVVYKN
ncbi:MAG: hypothetical protein ABIP95_05370 [Pelobium sp.]